jgi:hypothetical protein
MARLSEMEYEKIFQPKTMTNLKNKSGESYKQNIGDKDLARVMQETQNLLPEVIDAEEGYRDELEMLAAQIVSEYYPIIDMQNIKIDAKIVGMGDMNIQPGENEVSADNAPTEAEKAKRTIIKGIGQGGSTRGAFSYQTFKEYLDEINPALIEKYNNILKLSLFGVYDNEKAIALLLSLLAQGQKAQGGESEMDYDEENKQFVIKARAICFPMLVHEIVKGLFAIIGTKGFGPDKEKNQAIVNAVDKLENEPRDIQYGKFMYDAINNLYIESDIDDARVRELFFAKLFTMPEAEFILFIENAINDELTSQQKQYATNIMNKLAELLKEKNKQDKNKAAEDAIRRQRGGG